MEQLIVLAILGILSMLFKGKKPEEAPKTQKKQQTPQTGSPDPMRKLKEMSQEMYKELQREFQQEIDEPPSRQSTERTPAPVVPLPSEVQSASNRETVRTAPASVEKKQARTSNREANRGRLSAHQESIITREQIEHDDLIPHTQEDLIKGIIFAEILGPPKSKQ